MIKCQWCNSDYEWDWEMDEIIGIKDKNRIVLGSSSLPGVSLEVYLCPKCNGILAITSSEPNGGGVYEYNPNYEEE